MSRINGIPNIVIQNTLLNRIIHETFNDLMTDVVQRRQ